MSCQLELMLVVLIDFISASKIGRSEVYWLHDRVQSQGSKKFWGFSVKAERAVNLQNVTNAFHTG